MADITGLLSDEELKNIKMDLLTGNDFDEPWRKLFESYRLLRHKIRHAFEELEHIAGMPCNQGGHADCRACQAIATVERIRQATLANYQEDRDVDKS